MSGIESGAVPSELDVRLRRREPMPMPPDALVAFERINRGKNPSPNYRWLLLDDGALYLARHSGDTSDWETPFDTPLPKEPTRRLEESELAEVRRHLQAADLPGQPPYQLDPGVEDGAFSVVTARLDGQVHEVIYEACAPPLVTFLRSVAEEQP